MQPYAAHGWLELSKLEEDCGRQVDAVLVVRQGLDFCTLSDALLTRAIKHAEIFDSVI